MTDLPVVYGDTGLEFRRLMQWDEAEALVGTLARITRSCAWWWGDFLGYVEKAYPESWTQLIPGDLNQDTLRNWKWVSERFPPGSRDPDLPWSLYQAAAGIENQAARLEVIGMAKDQGMSTRAVRDMVRESKGREKAGKELECPACGHVWRA